MLDYDYEYIVDISFMNFKLFRRFGIADVQLSLKDSISWRIIFMNLRGHGNDKSK